MISYLHIACRQYHLLLDAQHVREVIELEEADEGSVHGFRLWRGSRVPVLDLRAVLGDAAPALPRAGLVCGESDSPRMLLCDRVFGIVTCEETAFKKLPHSAGAVAHLFDGVMPDDATGQLMYNLKPGVML